jgi:hypothetical protein
MLGRREHRDPVTGDILTQGEYISWIIQGIIRRWTFLGLLTVVTILAWITRNETVLLWWNLGASYLALVIESIVGLGMYSQTRRDAVVMREVRAMSQHIEGVAEALLKDVVAIEKQLEETPADD